MSRLIESIRLENGVFANLDYHQDRMDAAFRDVFGKPNHIVLNDYLKSLSFPTDGLYKCRLVYDNTMCQVTFTPYSIKPVTRLKIIYSTSIEYAFKYEDRSTLTKAFAQRGDCDDIIIVKNDFITDSYYANLIFLDGSTWYTPSQPLLKGTYRQYLLDHGKIKEAAIHVDDVLAFSHVRLINALLRFDGPELSVTQIVF